MRQYAQRRSITKSMPPWPPTFFPSSPAAFQIGCMYVLRSSSVFASSKYDLTGSTVFSANPKLSFG